MLGNMVEDKDMIVNKDKTSCLRGASILVTQLSVNVK